MKKLLLILLFFAAATVFADAQTKKFQGEVYLGYNIGNSPSINVQAIYGIRFSDRFFAGIGVGGDYFHDYDEMDIPIFINAKKYFSTTKKMRPYFSMDIGYNAGISGGIKDIGGFMVSPSFGWRGKNLSLQVGFLNQNFIDGGWCLALYGLQFKVGYNF